MDEILGRCVVDAGFAVARVEPSGDPAVEVRAEDEPVDDPEALKTVFQKIDQMKQARVEKTIAEPMDFFGPYVIAGLVLLGLGLLALFGLRYTPW